MKSRTIYFSLSLLTSASVFAADTTNTTSNETSPQAVSQTTASTDMQANKDSEFVAFLITLNKNEVAVADLALTKGMDSKANDFAKMLKKDHSQGLEKTMEVSKDTKIDPVDTQMVIDLQQKGQQELSSLGSMQGKDFEVAFIDAMVAGHQNALDTIKGQFKGNLKNDKLKGLMEKTKARVQNHLDQAQKIQKKLKDNSNNNNSKQTTSDDQKSMNNSSSY